MWILDPGHGGVKDGKYQTPGKRSPIWEDGSQYFEGVGNRKIAHEVGDALDDLGISYRYTVSPNNPEDVPLRERVEFANNLNYKSKVFVSIHSDAFSKPSAHGWSVFTSPGRTKSDDVATRFFLEAKRVFPGERFRLDTEDGDPDKEANFYVLRKTTCPAILLENFFMTNPRECKEILMTEEGRKKIVKYIVNAIVHIEQNGI